MSLTVITGQPASGKTTYVKANARRGDIIIDFDLIAAAMTANPATEHDYPPHVRACAAAAWRPARDQAITLSTRHTVWLIHAAPSPQQERWYRARGAAIVHLKIDRATQEHRIATRASN